MNVYRPLSRTLVATEYSLHHPAVYFSSGSAGWLRFQHNQQRGRIPATSRIAGSSVKGDIPHHDKIYLHLSALCNSSTSSALDCPLWLLFLEDFCVLVRHCSIHAAICKHSCYLVSAIILVLLCGAELAQTPSPSSAAHHNHRVRTSLRL